MGSAFFFLSFFQIKKVFLRFHFRGIGRKLNKPLTFSTKMNHCQEKQQK